MSGHSKWSQIKHKKALTDAKRGRLFSKMVREIMIAAREDPSPEANPRLRTALERARAIGLPKENMERAISRAAGEGAGLSLQEFLYEATAPGGVLMIIEGITDSKNRTSAEIKHLLSERGAKLADPGSVLWNFEKIGTLEVSKEENQNKSKDEVELAVIESGARDFTETDDTWFIETEFTGREEVRHKLEGAGLKIKEASYDYKPRSTLELAGSDKEKVLNILDAILEQEDIQEIYTNLKE